MTATAIGISNYLNDKTFRFAKGSSAEQKALNVIFDEASENDRKYRELVRNLNHEVKTPLTSLRLVAEGIEDGVFSPDEKTCREIIENVKRLDATLSAVKRYVEYQSRHDKQCEYDKLIGEPAISNRNEYNQNNKNNRENCFSWHHDNNAGETCDPIKTVDSVVSMYDEKLRESVLSFEYKRLAAEDLQAFCADNNISNLEVRLAECDLRASISSIIDNVMQHAHGANRCEIVERITGDGKKEKLFSISVIDNGCGCDASPENMMSPLWKADDSHTKQCKYNKESGCGMGLACTREAVLSAGGFINIESSADNGCVVNISLPIK